MRDCRFREAGIGSAARQGGLFALTHLAVVPGALLFGWASGRLTPARQLSLMLAIMVFGLVLIGASTGSGMLLAGLAVQQMAAGMAVPTLIAWARGKTPSAMRGRGMGLWTSAFFMGQFLSPAAFALTGIGLASVLGRFLLFGSFGLALAAVLFALCRRPTKDLA
ncbi:MAG: MFS transporter [Sphingomicrobium sp.]